MPLSQKAQEYCEAVWAGNLDKLNCQRVEKLERLRAGLVHPGDIYNQKGFWNYLEPDCDYVMATGTARNDCLREAYALDRQPLSEAVVDEILTDVGYRVESVATRMISEKEEEMKEARAHPTLQMVNLPTIADVSMRLVEAQRATMVELKRLLTIQRLREEHNFRPTEQTGARSGGVGRFGRGDNDDRIFARLAIGEARKSVPETDGRAHPLVGAVIVKDGQVLATAHRGESEGNHAEYIALEKRLPDAAVAGATVFTTLEPCTTRNHPKVPCAERLIERKVARVVIGMLDPDPRISGKGQRRLRTANIITDFFPHDLMTEVEELNRDFSRACELTARVADTTPPTDQFKAGIGKHRSFVLEKLEDTERFGLVSIYCYPPYPVEIPVVSLEQFVQESRFKFSESMSHFPAVEVFQYSVSVGYFPRAIRPDVKSAVRITLYRDGLLTFDALADTFMRGEGLHAGWLAYELQRHLQLARAFVKRSGFSKFTVLLDLKHIEKLALNSPSLAGPWLEPKRYAGPHDTISRVVNVSDVHDHDGEKRNIVMPAVSDIIAEVYRIYGQSKVWGVWDGDSKLTFVKGFENQR